MEYLDTLLASRLTMAPWSVVAAWLALFVVNHIVVRQTRALHARQTWYVVEDREALTRASRPPWMLGQVLYAACVFAVSGYVGGPVFVFLGGGLDVCLICVLGMNVQALLSMRAMRRGMLEGSTKMSTAFTFRQYAARLAGATVMCLLIGLLLAHLAPLGGAALCASTASGHLRRAAACNGA